MPGPTVTAPPIRTLDHHLPHRCRHGNRPTCVDQATAAPTLPTAFIQKVIKFADRDLKGAYGWQWVQPGDKGTPLLQQPVNMVPLSQALVDELASFLPRGRKIVSRLSPGGTAPIVQRYNPSLLTSVAEGFHIDLLPERVTWLSREFTYVWPIYAVDGVSAILEFEQQHAPNAPTPCDLSVLGNGTCTRNVIRMPSSELVINHCARHRVTITCSAAAMSSRMSFLRLRAVIIMFAQDEG